MPTQSDLRNLLHGGDAKGSADRREWRVDAAIAELAGRQHGVLARRQLIALGIGRGAIADRLRRGSLHRVYRGVYAVGHPAIALPGRWMAAVLAAGPEAVLSHRAAAELWGMLPRSGRLADVSRPGRAGRGHPFRLHASPIPADERTMVEEIPVTTVPRTTLDLAATEPRSGVERAMHEAEVRQLTDPLSIPDLLRRYPRRAGRRLLRELLGGDSRDGVTANEFEELFAALVERHGLPEPRYNPDLRIGGRFLRPDCAWPERRLIVELDGHGVHGTRRAFEDDRERDRVVMAAGWRVVRVTWRQLNREPEAVAADVGGALSTLSA